MRHAASVLYLSYLLLAISRQVVGQGLIGNLFPCEAPGQDPDPNNPEDNLSCPNTDPTILECYSRAELCNGVEFCSGGSDEAGGIAALECGMDTFLCEPGSRVPLSSICNGVEDCDGGDDETTTLCENKCLLPYYGGCSYTRFCITSEFDVNCGNCLPGFVEASPPTSDCLVAIGLQRTQYLGFEESQQTEEICATLLVDPNQLAQGLDRLFENLNINQITAIITPQMSTGANPATPVVDFNPQPMAVQLSAASPVACVRIPIVNDIIRDPDEVFEVELTTPFARAVVSPQLRVADVVITDNDDEVTAVYQQVQSTVLESEPNAEICVAIISPIVNSLSATSTIMPTFLQGGSATNNIDYFQFAIPPTLTFTAGSAVTNSRTTSSSQCFSVPIIDDLDVDPGENFILGLTNPNGLINNDENSQTSVEIIDDDVAAVVGFSRIAYEGDEGITLEVCARILSLVGGNALSRDVTVNVTSTSFQATATAVNDYTPVIALPVTFSAGSVVNSESCFDVDLASDTLVEGNEFFFLGMVPASPLVTVDDNLDEATVTILDLDRAIFVLNMDAFRLREDQGPQTVSVLLSNGVQLATNVEVLFTTQDGTAVASGDYTAVSRVLIFTPTSPIQMAVDVPIIDDIDVEPDETLSAAISIQPGFTNLASTGTPSTATITIEDDDAIIFDVSLTSNPVPEAAGTTILTITPRDAIPGPDAIVLTIRSSSGSATDGEDYDSIDTTVTFPVGTDAIRSVPIPITNDRFVEGPENFIVSVTSTNPRVTINGAQSSIEIIDDDVIIYGFTLPRYSVIENAGPLEAFLQLTLASGIPLSPFDIFVTTTDDSATSPADYIGLSNVRFTFPIMSQPGDTVRVPVAIIDDTLVEGVETFDLSATSPNQAAMGVLTEAVGAISDSDRPSVGFQQIQYIANEEMIPGQVEVCVELTSSGTHPNPITVLLSTTDGTATAPMDYGPLVNSVLVFPPQSSMGDSQCVDITINNDNVLELAGEFFFANITSPDADVDPGRESARITLQEPNDEVMFRFVPRDYTFPERDFEEEVCIEVTGGFLSEAVDLIITTSNINALAGSDYDMVNRVLTFPIGSRRECIPVMIRDDDAVEDDEQFNVNAILSSPIPGVSFDNSPATVTITDVDRATVALVTPPVAPEDGGPARVCAEIVSGSFGPGQSGAITFSTRDGSAEAPDDYISVTVEAVFNAANSDQMLCVDIPIVDDLLCEGPENLFVTISSNDPDIIISLPSLPVNIADNDVAEIGLDVLEPDMFQGLVQECANEEIIIRIGFDTAVTKGPDRECEITVRTQDGSAEAGSDYSELDVVCVLTDTITNCQYRIELMDDFEVEMSETFFILLESNDLSACRVNDGNTTVNITDDEDCDDGVCGEFDMCEELMCPNNFTCIPPEGVGDDPHFAVTLSTGKTLCYTVQGEHGFSFNLISNEKVYMNAMFVPDARREEVTWLGTMGIVINNNGYKKSNMTKLRFEAIKNKIHINDQMVLDARNIERITFENGKLTISEAPPTEGYKQPFVRVDLNDVELSFSIKFMTEHLDLYWHSTGQKMADSHGLIGQFFREDVSLDEVRKILILPGKEPVPVQRKPLWAFMERELGDSDNLCWVAMNPGYQGEGLIDGSYFDYLVDDVLSTEFKFKKL